MASQIQSPDQWIVIDDGKEPIKNVEGFDYFYREPKSGDPKHTMLLNLREAFKRIKGDYIIIIEDDEYYAPGYVRDMAELLEQYSIVGVGRSKYYHLPAQKYFAHLNMGHASLAQTAFRSDFLKEAINLLDGDSFFDIRLWRAVNGRDADFLRCQGFCRETNDRRGIVFDDKDRMLYVGMKGLPGRPGIGVGHRLFNGYSFDKDYSMLKRWIPKNYKTYVKLKEDLQ